MAIEYIYLGFALLGGLGLLVSLLTGTDVDHGDLHEISHDTGVQGDSGPDSPKIFSLRIIFAFLLAFGIGAGSAWLLKSPVLVQMIVGFVAGLLTAIGIFYIFKTLYSLQGNSTVSSESFIGKTAIVTIGTTSTGSCQVDVDTDGGDSLFMAKELTGHTLKKSDSVRILGRTGNVLIVEKQ